MIRCGHCGHDKPRSEFYTATQWCKECRKADEKRRRADPRLRAKARSKAENDIAARARYVCTRAKKRAKMQGVPFDLTPQWVEVKLRRGFCEVTDIPFSLRVGRDNPYGPSLDRKRAGGGYTQENCRLVLSAVNAALMDWGLKAFAPIAAAIAQRWHR